jgi:hypothetical protein
MANKPKQGAGQCKPFQEPPEPDVGGNAPRGDTVGFPEIGETGGPGGVEPSGGVAETREREGSGVPLGMTPGDLQKSPEELLEEWTKD